jgi:hypothetical protein
VQDEPGRRDLGRGRRHDSRKEKTRKKGSQTAAHGPTLRAHLRRRRPVRRIAKSDASHARALMGLAETTFDGPVGVAAPDGPFLSGTLQKRFTSRQRRK